MYAVIESGGKQHKVTLGKLLKVDTIAAEPGTTIEFDKVLLIANGEDLRVGTPYLEEKVSAEVVTHGRHPKVEIIKFKRRKHHMKHAGHRQDYTEVKITKIAAEALKPKAKKAAKKAPQKAEKESPVKEAETKQEEEKKDGA